jgi:HK97 family phage major capsid protein
MHDQILLKIKQLKDGFGRYLWQAGLAYGTPDTLDGDPIFINQSMDSTVASTKKTVAYGALKKYKIRDVSSIRLRRLVERYADADQEAFVLFARADGNLLDAGTHPIKYMVH